LIHMRGKSAMDDSIYNGIDVRMPNGEVPPTWYPV